MSTQEQLELASEFRESLPQRPTGGYAEVVVERDGSSDRFAVTDGALTGLQAWVDDEGWQYVTDIGRRAAFNRTRADALTTAHQVAALEADRHHARIAAADPRPH